MIEVSSRDSDEVVVAAAEGEDRSNFQEIFAQQK